jgi:hypothetical protein
MSTGPRDRAAVCRGGDYDEGDHANPAHAASTPTSASTTSARFIENTLTAPDDRSAAAGDLIPTVSCPFVPVSGDAEPYSVFWKLRTARASIVTPNARTISTSVQIGTTQPLMVSGAASLSPSITRRMGSIA